MAAQRSVVQILVASPGDVADERRVVGEVVAEINRVWGSDLGVTLVPVGWELNVYPTFAEDAQAVVNDQIGDDYDIFLGIFWSRAGTPTPRAQSGTIEEFERALKRFRETDDKPEIMLYFKEAPVRPSSVDPVQLGRLQAFRSSIVESGGLFAPFDDTPAFASLVRSHLSLAVQKLVRRRRLAAAGAAAATSPPLPSVPVEPADTGDYVLADYLAIYTVRQEEMTFITEAINRATRRMGEQISRHGQHIRDRTVSADDPRPALRSIRRAAEDMNAYAEILAGHVPLMSHFRHIAFDALSKALVFDVYTELTAGEFGHLRDTLGRLLISVVGAVDGMQGLQRSVVDLPFLGERMEAAKRRAAASLARFLAELGSTRSALQDIIASLDTMRRASLH